MLNKSKRAALELSVSTIVVIVLAVTMLIIGMVLVRNIMCNALGLTGDINDKVRGEITRLFGSSGGEVECIGSGTEPIQIVPGRVNIIYCGIQAPRASTYGIKLSAGAEGLVAPKGITADKIRRDWVTSESVNVLVVPGERSDQKVIRLDVPDDAPEGLLIMKLDISKKDEGETTSTPLTAQTLDFEIKRVGLVRSSVC